MKVCYSRRAARDLDSIHSYLSKYSLTGAKNVLVAIYVAIEFIRRNPGAAEQTTIGDVKVKSVRKYRFRIFYRVHEQDEAIEIVHVRHTSRRQWTGE